MISFLFHTLFYNPIYNSLIFLESTFTWMDLGIAIILVTILVKILMFPLAKSSIKTQIKIKQIEPLLNELKEKYKDNKEEQARKTMDLYKEYGVNPFSSFFLILIQLPILFALYFVFLNGGLPNINSDILYSFIKIPESINVNFLQLIDISQKSFLLALSAGISQFFQIKLVMPPTKEIAKDKRTLKDDLVRNMQLQMQYIMPFFIFFVSFSLSGAIALYWTTSNLFMIGQELYVRKNIKNQETVL